MAINQRFSPIVSIASNVIEIDRDPCEVSASVPSGYATLKTYTFTPDQLRNNRFQITEFTFTFQGKASSTISDWVKLTVTNQADTALKAGVASYKTYSWNIPVQDYSQTMTITVLAASNNVAQFGQEFVLEAKVITYVG